VITSDDTDHGFRIPKANIDAAIPQQGKGELKIRFVAREKGVFAFECSRPCGAGHNLMRGTIVVE
jgi:heme/copper-type cytochrome/quinol oxidase subunit 2